MTYVTFVTACAPYHTDLLERAAASVRAQTIPCAHVAVMDRDRRGPAWARNRGLEQVRTDFTVFLDADDWIEPTFAEKTLRAYDGKRYIFTDWVKDGEPVQAPDCPWINNTWHCISALIPTDWIRYLGGFDETVEGAEDTLFFVGLTRRGVCGKRLAEPLFHYGKDGQRSKQFVNSAAHDRVLHLISKRYGALPMACCGQNVTVTDDERQSTDVLVKALWGGNRRERGRMTGRMYPRTGNGAQVWIDPRDADAAPWLWQRVNVLPEVPPPALDTAVDTSDWLDGAAGIGDFLFPQPERPVYREPRPAPTNAPHAVNYAALLAKAQRGMAANG